ncbi:unnamed protein product [Cuscuta campestris]|uniref:Longin domain-containing protein n=1 Tax=Cuscuta campestris TaxID=132261 RepID=A0A484M0W1_9ASTE|nr:unnamed protein product [Cuscuta campestris]
MDSSKKGVCYCSVSKGGRVLYTYNNDDGDMEIENLAAQCLGKAPPHHKWYFQTMGKKTFCFLMEEDGYIYFAIAEESLGNAEALRFLHNLRGEFEKHARRGSSGRSTSSLSSIATLQEQLVPVIKNLITSLENVSGGDHRWPAMPDPVGPASTFPDASNGQAEGGSSTRAPLLSKCDKKSKSSSSRSKRSKDHMVGVRGIELEERRKSNERVDLEASGGSPALLQKDFGSGRMATRGGNNQSFQKKWCRLVRIILAVDGAVCLVLLVIWLVVCEGTKCLS